MYNFSRYFRTKNNGRDTTDSLPKSRQAQSWLQIYDFRHILSPTSGVATRHASKTAVSTIKRLPEINSALFITLFHSTVSSYKCSCIFGFKVTLIAGVCVDKPEHPFIVFFAPTIQNIEFICAVYGIIYEM